MKVPTLLEDQKGGSWEMYSKGKKIMITVMLTCLDNAIVAKPVKSSYIWLFVKVIIVDRVYLVATKIE